MRLPSKLSEEHLRRLARRYGYDLVRADKPHEPYAQLIHSLRLFGIDSVLDVGANRGQYARRIRRSGYRGPILSFEPLPEEHALLTASAQDDPEWRVAPPMALGAEEGEAVLECSAERDMSSLLPQNDLLRRISPTSRVERRLRVPLRRLDRCGELDPDWRRIFLKIDTQGYEEQVLEGAAELWPRIVGVQLEMALVPLYQGERDFRDMIARMEERGFELHLLIPGYYERKLGRHLQVDGVFFRPQAAAAESGHE